MKILHYSLGQPPYRSGGLTKYATDLMLEQKRMGHEVYNIYPGRIGLRNNQIKLKKDKSNEGVEIYEIVNPNYVPLLNGVVNPEDYFIQSDINEFKKFINELAPDIVHIHTLMGLKYEILQYVNQKNIKLIYTTHDYFGICPKVNLFDIFNTDCSEGFDFNTCVKCNSTGLSKNKIIILQSLFYREFKKLKIFHFFRDLLKEKFVKSSFDSGNKREIQSVSCDTKVNKAKNMNINKTLKNSKIYFDKSIKKKYIELQKYYFKLFSEITYFHFNSKISMNVFEKHIKCDGEVIPIYHSSIVDNRHKKNFNSDTLNISYIGNKSPIKGLNQLKEAVDKLISENKNFKLHMYGDNFKFENSRIVNHGKYNYNMMKSIMDNSDVLVMPSIWKETFGFVALEALSFGVPIIISQNAGINDIVENMKNAIVYDGTVEGLYKTIKLVIEDRNILKSINEEILKMDYFKGFTNHTNDIINLYNKVLTA